MKKLSITPLEGLELISWARVRKGAGMILSEELLHKITEFVYASKGTQMYCECCKMGDCTRCINFTAKKDICVCNGVYHVE